MHTKGKVIHNVKTQLCYITYYKCITYSITGHLDLVYEAIIQIYELTGQST